MSPKDEAIGMVIPDGFRRQAWRPPALNNFLVNRGVLVTLTMWWFDGLITRKSQERTKGVYDYRVPLEEYQSVRSMTLPLGVIQDGNKRGGGCVGFSRG